MDSRSNGKMKKKVRGTRGGIEATPEICGEENGNVLAVEKGREGEGGSSVFVLWFLSGTDRRLEGKGEGAKFVQFWHGGLGLSIY